MKIKYQIAFLFFIFSLASPSAYAWQVPIEVATFNGNGGRVYNRLVVGMEPGATGGFDNLWDTPAILSHPDPDRTLLLRAYITPPSDLPPQGREEKVSSPLTGEGQGGGGDGEISKLWKDIRGTSAKGDTVWDITVDSVPAGKTVVVSWNLPQGMLKGGERLALRDNDAEAVDGTAVRTDLSGTSGYVFVSGGEGPRSLSLVYSKENILPSGGGSGFGCGTVKAHHDEPPDGWRAASGLLALLLPLVFMRLTSLRDYLYNLTISHGEDTHY